MIVTPVFRRSKVSWLKEVTGNRQSDLPPSLGVDDFQSEELKPSLLLVKGLVSCLYQFPRPLRVLVFSLDSVLVIQVLTTRVPTRQRIQ